MPTIITPTPPKPFIAYTAQELKTLFPEAFDKALEQHKEKELEYQNPYYGQEVWGSYKTLIEALNFNMVDYSFAYFESYRNKIHFSDNDALELEGVRAYKYVVNRLDVKQYNGWGVLDLTKQNNKKAYERRKQPWGKPWVKNDCPLTGVCYDDMLIDKLAKYLLKDKAKLLEALAWLMDGATTIIEKEYRSRCTEAYFLEECDERELLFTDDGKEV